MRAKVVADLKGLDRYAYTSHSVLMGKRSNDWQNVDDVLLRYCRQRTAARKKYREFVQKGLSLGKRDDLIGGGLIRSAGGWSAVKALRRAKAYMKGDERILGDSEFVQSVLKQSEQAYDRRYRLKARGVDLDVIAHRVTELLDISMEELWSTVMWSKPEVCYVIGRCMSFT